MTKPVIPEKYRFFKALRPFSLSVAVVTCGLGISLALADGIFHPFRAVVVLVAGLLLQSAVNLFNDYADLAHLHCSEDISTGLAVKAIYRNTAVAVVMTVVACLLGLYLIMFAGWPLFWVGLAGIAGGYFYTGAPIAYKNRGLGIIGVFIFTGVLMVGGAYLAVGGSWSVKAFLLSIPVSLISSMLLLGNELRDYQEDLNAGIGTFTVKVGYDRSRQVYLGLLCLVILASLMISVFGYLSSPWLLLISIPAIFAPVRLLESTDKEDEQSRLVRLPPLTGRFFLLLGIGYMLAL